MLPVATPRDDLFQQLVLANRCLDSWRGRVCVPEAELLSKLLTHATATVPYYRSLFPSCSAEASVPLASFPLLSRQIVESRPQDLLSEGFDAASLIIGSTSGTEGMPVQVARDPASWYGMVYASYDEVGRYLPGFRSALKAGATAVVFVNGNGNRLPNTYINPSLGCALVHRFILGEVGEANVGLVKALRTEPVPCLYGRPRTLVRLAELDALHSTDDERISANAILTSGDNLYDHSRKHLESWFRCRVHNAYGSQECGVIAVECENRTGLHLLNGKAVVEILGQNQSISDIGTGEMIVTNLENWAMPFIRYRTRDCATVVHNSCPCGYSGQSIVELWGRNSPYFTVADRQLPVSLFGDIFCNLPIEDFQIRQLGACKFKITWTTTGTPGANAQDISAIVLERFRQHVTTAEVDIAAVDNLGSPDRKIPRYIRDYNPG